jgi:hypothetical protein
VRLGGALGYRGEEVWVGQPLAVALDRFGLPLLLEPLREEVSIFGIGYRVDVFRLRVRVTYLCRAKTRGSSSGVEGASSGLVW